jgi:ribosome-binding factor A
MGQETNVATRSFNRAERVGGQIQKILAGLIRKGINDPRLSLTTVTGVTLSRDLRIAKVYVATRGGADSAQAVLSGFESAKGFIKRKLAGELGLRYMPDLRFFYDASFDYGAHIERVLKSIRTEDEKNNPAAGEQ